MCSMRGRSAMAAVFAVPWRHMGTVAIHCDGLDHIGLGVVIGVDNIGARAGMVGGFTVTRRSIVCRVTDSIGFRLWSNDVIIVSAVAHMTVVVMPGLLRRSRRIY